MTLFGAFDVINSSFFFASFENLLQIYYKKTIIYLDIYISWFSESLSSVER